MINFDSKLKWEAVTNYAVTPNFSSMMLCTFFSITLNILMLLLEQAEDTQSHARMKSTCESHIIKPVIWCFTKFTKHKLKEDFGGKYYALELPQM